uniref:RING-type E3 ubiquitin transferase n=1 Tax=Anas platyrhynchos platyrhynchos TaxID=8840 RepID=A0A493TJC8_ANAPP
MPSKAAAGSGQMQQAGPSEAAAGERCPICLGTTRNTAYTYTCFHAFCFRCIRRWAATISACPLCRQPIDRTPPGRGSAADPLSAATTCAHGP